MSVKNSNDTLGNRNRDLPACTAVPQPSAPPRTRKTGLQFNKTSRSWATFRTKTYINLLLESFVCHYLMDSSCEDQLRGAADK